LSGLLTAGITYLIILFGKGTKKSKLIWTSILLLSIVIEQLSESTIIKASYLIYVSSNQVVLSEINELLNSHKGTIYIVNDEISTNDMKLTDQEKNRLLELREDSGAYLINKSENEIYYGLSGFLDIRHGIWYSINNKTPETSNELRLLTNNWYY